MNTVKIYTELRSDFIEHNLGESHVIMTGGPVTGGARGAGGAGGVAGGVDKICVTRRTKRTVCSGMWKEAQIFY